MAHDTGLLLLHSSVAFCLPGAASDQSSKVQPGEDFPWIGAHFRFTVVVVHGSQFSKYRLKSGTLSECPCCPILPATQAPL